MEKRRHNKTVEEKVLIVWLYLQLSRNGLGYEFARKIFGVPAATILGWKRKHLSDIEHFSFRSARGKGKDYSVQDISLRQLVKLWIHTPRRLERTFQDAKREEEEVIANARKRAQKNLRNIPAK